MSNEEAVGIVNEVRGMSSKQLVAVITLMISAVGGAFWIENRYAKLDQTEKTLKAQAQELERNRQSLVSVLNSLPKDQQAQFHELMKNQKEFSNQMKFD